MTELGRESAVITARPGITSWCVTRGVRRLLTGVVMLVFLSPSPVIGKDYCQMQVFNASCPSGQVILMKSARYGRMKLGDCLTTDIFIGCSDDILPQLDQRCSGRRQCEIKLPDQTLHEKLSCPKDLMAYLEAEYSCVQVFTARDCRHNKPVHVSPSDKDGKGGVYLTSLGVQTSAPGSPQCPWILTAQPGQFLKTYLMDFTNGLEYKLTGTTQEEGSMMCPALVTFQDGRREKPSERCVGTGEAERKHLVHMSKGHNLQISVNAQHIPGMDVNFLLKTEVDGCADPPVPADGWLTRTRPEAATVSCNHTSQRWHLVCRDTSWVGSVGNCTSDFGVAKPNKGPKLSAPYGLFIAVVIGVLIGIVCGFGMLGTVLWCKKSYHGSRRRYRNDEGHYGQPILPSTTTTASGQPCKVHRVGDYGYSHVWQVRQAGTSPRPHSHPGIAPGCAGGASSIQQPQQQGDKAGSSAQPQTAMQMVTMQKREVQVGQQSPKPEDHHEAEVSDSEHLPAPPSDSRTCYHDYDVTNQLFQCHLQQQQQQQQPPGQQGANRRPPHLDVIEGTSDDTDEDLDKQSFILHKPRGYSYVPSALDRERCENQYS